MSTHSGTLYRPGDMLGVLSQVWFGALRASVLTFVVLWSVCAHAEEDKYAAVRDKLATCAACHGGEGASSIPLNPTLGGQHLHYLYVQLKDLKSGRRENAIMQPNVAALEKEDMLLLAEYYSKQKWVDTDFKATSEQVTTGKRVVSAGQCVQCHLGGFEGSSGVPRLAGQHYEYLLKTMLEFKQGIRKNSPAKVSLLKSFSDEDIEAVSAYLSGFNN